LAKNLPSQTPAVYLFVLPWEPHYVGGVSSVVNNLASAMADRGSFTPSIAVDSWNDVSPRVTEECILFRFSILGPASIFDYLKACARGPVCLWRTLHLLRSYNAQVVNFHYPGLAPLGVALLKRLGLYRGKLLLSFHGTDVAPSRSWTERIARRFIYSAADRLVACSNSLAARMRSQLDVPGSKVAVIFNGVDESVFDGLHKHETISQLKLPENYILNIGSFIPRKNHRLLIEAFGLLAPRYPSLHLCIAGADGPDRYIVENEVRARGLANRVHLFIELGQTEVAVALSRAAVCVQTSLAESFPLAVLEAGASGTPLVVSDIPGHEELVADSTTGLHFPLGDASACATAISTMLDDPRAASKMALAQRQQVKENFTLLSNLQQYERLASNKY